MSFQDNLDQAMSRLSDANKMLAQEERQKVAAVQAQKHAEARAGKAEDEAARFERERDTARSELAAFRARAEMTTVIEERERRANDQAAEAEARARNSEARRVALEQQIGDYSRRCEAAEHVAREQAEEILQAREIASAFKQLTEAQEILRNAL